MPQRREDQESDPHAEIREVTTELGILKDWRPTVDANLKKLNQAIFEGDGPDRPSLVTLVAMINQKIEMIGDLVNKGVKALEAMAKSLSWFLAIIIALIVIWGAWGPAIRHALNLPVASTKAPIDRVQSTHSDTQDAGGTMMPNH